MATGTTLLERLPTELLSQIITSYLKENGSITVITQVCRRLRHVAFGMQSIWTTIRILTTDTFFKLQPESQYGYKDVRNFLH
jgi:hypothetical protein